MDSSIKNVYVGLPDHLVDRILWVARKFRTNPLSYDPGGSDVIVEYHLGNALGYDWIKYPSLYISSIFDQAIIKEYKNFEDLEETDQLGIVKSKFNRIYARKYKDEDEFLIVPFEEIWNSLTATSLPWKVLQRFDIYPNKTLKQYSSKNTELVVRS